MKLETKAVFIAFGGLVSALLGTFITGLHISFLQSIGSFLTGIGALALFVGIATCVMIDLTKTKTPAPVSTMPKPATREPLDIAPVTMFPCNRCNRSGKIKATCSQCQGSGRAIMALTASSSNMRCGHCQGRGWGYIMCQVCLGDGYRRSDEM